MPNSPLDGPKVAILVTDGFEQIELEETRTALDKAGAWTMLDLFGRQPCGRAESARVGAR